MICVDFIKFSVVYHTIPGLYARTGPKRMWVVSHRKHNTKFVLQHSSFYCHTKSKDTIDFWQHKKKNSKTTQYKYYNFNYGINENGSIQEEDI